MSCAVCGKPCTLVHCPQCPLAYCSRACQRRDWSQWHSRVHSRRLCGDCTICMDPVYSDQEQRLRCGHSFHSGCVSVWLKRQGTCPLCRAQICAPEVRDTPHQDLAAVAAQLLHMLELMESMFEPLPTRNDWHSSQRD